MSTLGKPRVGSAPLARPGGRVLVLGRGRGRGGGGSGGSGGGPMAPARLNAPKPLSLPSLKKENKGFDPTVVMVPAGGAGWGSSSDGGDAAFEDADGTDASHLDASDYPALGGAADDDVGRCARSDDGDAVDGDAAAQADRVPLDRYAVLLNATPIGAAQPVSCASTSGGGLNAVRTPAAASSHLVVVAAAHDKRASCSSGYSLILLSHFLFSHSAFDLIAITHIGRRNRLVLRLRHDSFWGARNFCVFDFVCLFFPFFFFLQHLSRRRAGTSWAMLMTM